MKEEVEEEIAPLKKEARKEEKNQERLEVLIKEVMAKLERLEKK
jgi:hypothetical protein